MVSDWCIGCVLEFMRNVIKKYLCRHNIIEIQEEIEINIYVYVMEYISNIFQEEQAKLLVSNL